MPRLFILFMLLAFLSIACANVSPSPTPTRFIPTEPYTLVTPHPILVTPRPTREPTKSQNAVKWYEGGTLHKNTAAEWVTASDRDRLATSADFASTLLRQSTAWSSIESLDDVRSYALAMKECIDASYYPQPIVPTMSNAEAAAACWVLMYPDLTE